jgi:hypothetical protein
MLAFQHFFDLFSTPNGCYGIDIYFYVFNESYYQANFVTSCKLNASVFGFSRIIFDKTSIEALGYQYFSYGELDSVNGDSSPLTFQTIPYIDGNFMLGMKSWLVNGISSFNFMSLLGETTTISSTTLYS